MPLFKIGKSKVEPLSEHSGATPNGESAVPQGGTTTGTSEKGTTEKCLQIEADDESSKVKSPLYKSRRLLLAVMGMLGSVAFHICTNSMSVALICMTNNSSSSTSSSQQNQTSSFYTYSEEMLISSNMHKPSLYAVAEFNWSRDLQGWILSSYFIGVTSVRIIAGILANKFGGRLVLGIAGVAMCVLTLLTPVLARAHIALLMTVQVLKGFSAGMNTPSFYAMLGVWSPPEERGFLLSIFMIGMPLGTILGSVFTGFLCESDFAGGWPGIFYTFGMVAGVWCVAWFFLGYSSPDEHPRISQNELKYIQASLSSVDKTAKRPPVPWKQILTTPAVYAVYLAMIAWGWSWYTALTSLPQYLVDVLELDIQSNGLVNALPYIANAIVSTPASLIVAGVVSKKLLSLKWARKLAETISLVSAAGISIGIGYLTKDQTLMAITFLTAWVGLLAFSNSGSWCTFVDMAPRFAGVLKGIDATLNSLPGIIAPLIVGALTPNRSVEEWRVVFFMCAGISLFGWFIFLMLSTTDEQSWAKCDDIAEIARSCAEDGIEIKNKDSVDLENKDFDKNSNKLKRNQVAPLDAKQAQYSEKY